MFLRAVKGFRNYARYCTKRISGLEHPKAVKTIRAAAQPGIAVDRCAREIGAIVRLLTIGGVALRAVCEL
jgi:hypothetical protein